MLQLSVYYISDGPFIFVTLVFHYNLALCCGFHSPRRPCLGMLAGSSTFFYYGLHF
jgi:hypothetical protein